MRVGLLILLVVWPPAEELRVELIGNAGVVLSDVSTSLLIDLPYQSGASGNHPAHADPDSNHRGVRLPARLRPSHPARASHTTHRGAQRVLSSGWSGGARIRSFPKTILD
jgi:hypothetical protein